MSNRPKPYVKASKCILLRNSQTSKQITGTLLLYDGWGNLLSMLRTIETPIITRDTVLPFLPKGKYNCIHHKSERYAKCVQIQGVAEFPLLLIHMGNYYWQSGGCMLIGQELRQLEQDSLADVVNSFPALTELLDTTFETFNLTIVEAF